MAMSSRESPPWPRIFSKPPSIASRSPSFSAYVLAFQKITVLKMAELWMLIPAMKLVLLEQVAARGHRLAEGSIRFGECSGPDPQFNCDQANLMESS